MTMIHHHPITCPKCGTALELGVYETINVTLDPDLKEKVIDGTHNSMACTNCGQHIATTAPLLYHDMDRQLMIWFEEDPEEPGSFFKNAPELQKKLSEGYIFREVHQFYDLVEKISIFDVDLNDTIVDMVKGLIMKQSQGELSRMYFSDLRKDEEDTVLIFDCFDQQDKLMKAEVGLKDLGEQAATYLLDQTSIRTQQ